MSFGLGVLLVLAAAVVIGMVLARRELVRDWVRGATASALPSTEVSQRASPVPWLIRCHGGAEHVICQTCFLELAPGAYQGATALRSRRHHLAGERCSGCDGPLEGRSRR